MYVTKHLGIFRPPVLLYGCQAGTTAGKHKFLAYVYILAVLVTPRTKVLAVHDIWRLQTCQKFDTP